MKLFLIASSLLFATQAFAGEGSSCHFHGKKPALETSVLDCAAKKKDSLIEKGKIDAAWKGINHEKIEQVEMKNGKKEWKVTFKDPQAKDKAKETLYMFFSLPGNFLASNFTGE